MLLGGVILYIRNEGLDIILIRLIFLFRQLHPDVDLPVHPVQALNGILDLIIQTVQLFKSCQRFPHLVQAPALDQVSGHIVQVFQRQSNIAKVCVQIGLFCFICALFDCRTYSGDHSDYSADPEDRPSHRSKRSEGCGK